MSAKRFFSDRSYWNQPIGDNPAIDPRSDELIAMMEGPIEEGFGPMHINIKEYTIPVYYADENTPLRKVHQRPPSLERGDHERARAHRFRRHPDFADSLVPIPEGALPDPARDSHLAIVDWKRRMAWDTWACHLREDGEYESYTGMVYSLDDEGIWSYEDFPAQNGDSIHWHGPSRAAGVPAIAGLILLDEVKAGRIEHKLAFASWANALGQHVYPAAWTDGFREDGLPEGATLQLDPDLDLDAFDLSGGARIVARALQEYGCVDVDNARANTLYAEGLQFRQESWESLLDSEDLRRIPLKHYRVLKLENIIYKGDGGFPGPGNQKRG